MRILHVARYGSVKGGTESYVRALCEAQRDAGHDVGLAYRLDPDASRPEVAAGFAIDAGLRDAAGAWSPHVIHVHNLDDPPMLGMLSAIAPTVNGVHDHRLDCPTGTRYWAAWGRACDVAPGGACLGYNVAAHCGSLKANLTLEPYRRWRALHAAASGGPVIQVFSSFMRAQLSRAGIAADVAVTPYPCPPLPRTEAAPSDRIVVFASGRLTKEKGFDVLLDAIDHVRTPLELRIAGDGHHAAALKRRRVRTPVTWLGWMAREALAAEYARATVVAVPSAWPEPFGIVGIEAGSAGKPVVATDIGGVREWLVDGVTGIAVPPRAPLAFASAIDTIAGDPALAARMGAAGRTRVETEFSMSRHLARVAELYEKARRSWEAAA